MDPQEKDAARLHRPETLARRIGKALDEMDSQSAGDCPDGEILAVYAERGLSAEETAKLESHFSTCSRCRKILLALDASADTPLAEKEVARLGELVAAARPAKGARTPSRLAWPRFNDWRMRWLAPAVGFAAVLTVVLVLRTTLRNRSELEKEAALVAQAPKQELPPSHPPSHTTEPQSAARSEQPQAFAVPQADRLPSSNALKAAPLNSPVSEFAKRKAEAGASSGAASPRTREANGSLQAQDKLRAPQDQREEALRMIPASPSTATEKEAPPPPPPAPPPPAKAAASAPAAEAAQLDAAANAVGGAVPSAKQTVTVTEQAELAPSAGAGPARAQASSESRMSMKKEQAFAPAAPLQKDSSLLKAPFGSALWRAGIGGKIERSADGGATWATQASPSQEDWLAGAAVSDSVCWLVGRRGAIARTMDGEHWDSIAPPRQVGSANGILPDWTAVAAADTQRAAITAADGRVFTTTNGGKSWRQQPQK